MPIQDDYDKMYMQHVISLAKQGWGKTGTNPLVGALVVDKDRIFGTGYHRKLGEVHAEVCALIDAGERAKSATLYVNLEPCCCTGRTPPCTEAISKAQIKRVVVGMIDPNPVVNGKGIEYLKEKNIEVRLNVLQEQAEQINSWYKKYITKKIPYVILKIAISMDGKISGFKEKYITSEAARRHVHSLRSQVSAVLVGINTVLIDNPYLTDRLICRNNPARVVIDPHLKIPLTANFLQSKGRMIIITDHNNAPNKMEKLKALGVEFLFFEGSRYPMASVIEKLGTLDIGSILVEGGAMIFLEFLNEKLYDELFLFVAPKIIGKGLGFSDDTINKIMIRGSQPQKIGEDLLYHVYRNN